MELERDRRRCVESAAHLTCLSEYLRAFTHEINNPLTVVYGEALRLRERVGAGHLRDSEVLHSTEIFERMSQRMIALTQELAAVLRTGGKSEDIGVRELMDLALKYSGREIERQAIDLDLSGLESRHQVRGRPLQMARALYNLIQNATEALGQKSAGQPRQLRIWSEENLPDSLLVLHICDNGPGVEASLRERLFEPFVSSKTQGAGLGLFAARLWLEQNGASVTCQSDEAETRFSVTFVSRP
ncbi:MAG: HAMP domain-containing sensor histidine kinase [Hyphomonadaceae bacterium]